MSSSRQREPTGAWMLTVGLHVLFIALVLVAVLRDRASTATLAGLGLIGWYLAGVALRKHRQPTVAMAWLIALTLGWAATTLAAPDFVWVAFPLFFLHLFLLPGPVGVVTVMSMLAVAVYGLSLDGSLTVGEVVGPISGATVAIFSASVFRAQAAENARTRRLLADLEEARGRLDESERQRGALEERRRLASEVHDTVAQGLSSILLLARAAEIRSADADTSGSISPMGRIADLAQENLDEARRIVAALGPPGLDDSTLATALEKLAGRWSERSATKVGFSVVGPVRPLEVVAERVLLRVAQGALANAVTHSGAEQVRVTLTYLTDSVTLDVVDRGNGFDVTDLDGEGDGSGYGMKVMRQRLEEIGGTFVVETTPGEGTAIMASVGTR